MLVSEEKGTLGGEAGEEAGEQHGKKIVPFIVLWIGSKGSFFQFAPTTASEKDAGDSTGNSFPAAREQTPLKFYFRKSWKLLFRTNRVPKNPGRLEEAFLSF